MNDLPGVPSRWKRMRSYRPTAVTLPGPEAVQLSGDMKVTSKWGSLSVPVVVITGLLSLVGGKVWDSGRAAEINASLRELAKDTRDARDEDRARIRDLNTRLNEEHQFTKHNIPIIARVVERQQPNAKFLWETGWQPDVDFLAPPLGGSSAPLQPASALVRPPTWDF